MAKQKELSENHIPLHDGNHYYVQLDGNSKVRCPIVSFGSAHECPSAGACRYHPSNNPGKDYTGFPICYAHRTESRFKDGVLDKRRNNASLIEIERLDFAGTIRTHKYGKTVGAAVVEHCRSKGYKYVRLNESGDLSDRTRYFLAGLVQTLIGAGLRVYTYSKAAADIREYARKLGVVVLDSDIDFVVVNNPEEAQEQGLKMCPGVGCADTCMRCPQGLQSAIKAH